MKLHSFFKIMILVLMIFTMIIPFSAHAVNTNYVSNRSPLVDTPFVPLPLGTVKADGWLLKMLQFQRDGFTGNAEALYSELGSNSAWLGGNAPNSDWERPPYYVKGLVALAYTLGDTNLQNKAKKWIDWAINSQQSNGYFGPSSNNDWWPRMPMLYAIKDFYEATGDSRVINFMTKYFQYQAANLGSRPLSDWGKARAGDNIDVVLWLYNRTGDSFLLTLADTLRNQAYNWTDICTNNTFKNFGSDFHPKHTVNVSQAIKMPAIYYQKSNATADKNAFINGDTNLLRDHGQVTGMPSGTEMLAGKSSIQGVETCAVVERMQSNEEAQMILGNPYIGDQLEKIAFNALPACFNKSDLHVHQYYHLPNQVQSIYGSHGYEQDYTNGLMPSPTSGYPCCRFNMHMGWPYFVKNMWAATNDNGLAVMAYGPSHLTAKVAGGVSVTITENTNYPFEEQIRFTLTTGSSVAFPLKLRIPGWCASPSVKVNGVVQSGVVANSYFTINRTWNNNDTITVDLPMSIKGTTQINNSIAIERGPLVYSLKIGEQWTVQSTLMPGYNENTVTPTTAWNYCLVLADRNNPGASLTVNQGIWPADNNPFLQSQTPVTITATGRKVTGWGISGVLSAEVPSSPVNTGSAEETIILVPFGAENIRLTYFPVYSGVSPSPTPPSSSFSDNFDDGNANGWTTYGGTWSVVSGQYNVASNPGAKSVANSTNFSNFTYEADVSINGGDAGIIFRVTNPGVGADAYNGYYAGLNSNGSVVLGKANNSWTQLASYNMTITSNTFYHMKVVTNGSNIQVFVTDMTTPKINFNDTSYTAGSIGVRTYNSAAKFDNIDVTTGSAPTPTNTQTPANTPTNTPTPVATPTPTNTPTASSGGVIFYQDVNYGGAASQVFAKGDYTLSQMIAKGCPNDWMSSLKVPGGWTVIVYQHDNFGGTSWTFTADTSWVGSACNDQMSSVKIQ